MIVDDTHEEVIISHYKEEKPQNYIQGLQKPTLNKSQAKSPLLQVKVELTL